MRAWRESGVWQLESIPRRSLHVGALPTSKWALHNAGLPVSVVSRSREWVMLRFVATARNGVLGRCLLVRLCAPE